LSAGNAARRAPVEQRVRFVANPTQRLFIENRPGDWLIRPPSWPADVKPQVVDLFSCRMGEGKSAGLCWAAWFYTKHNPGAQCALIRDTWENMRDTTRVEFLKWFGLMGEETKSAKSFKWTASGMTGTVTFMGMDDEKDAHKLQSREFGFFGMDEPSPAAGVGGIQSMIFETALTRLRQPGMQWYAAKLAQNNPDESHWTYKKFVDPGTKGYRHLQTQKPENESNLPPGYYAEMGKDLAGRPDLQRRFVEGQFGFQAIGQAVTPRWNDKVHLQKGLEPIPGCELILGWDGGLTPVCTVSQIAPSGIWYILDCLVEEDGGVYQLIDDQVFNLLEIRYANFKGKWRHIGDPSLVNRDQSDSRQSAARVIREKLGGRFTPGPIDLASGVDPLNKRLGLLGPGGQAMIQVDRERAKAVWHALRGGWHLAKHAGDVTGTTPVKNHPHSDVGDTMRYVAGILFPRGEQRQRRRKYRAPGYAHYSPSVAGTVKTLRESKVRLPEEFRTLP
jgi:hypothetical protein